MAHQERVERFGQARAAPDAKAEEYSLQAVRGERLQNCSLLGYDSEHGSGDSQSQKQGREIKQRQDQRVRGPKHQIHTAKRGVGRGRVLS